MRRFFRNRDWMSHMVAVVAASHGAAVPFELIQMSTPQDPGSRQLERELRTVDWDAELKGLTTT